MELEYLAQHVESLIFTSEHPITKEDIRDCLEETYESQVRMVDLEAVIEELKERYQKEDTAIELVEIAQGLQFLTKGNYHRTVGNYLKLTTKKRLSRAALETLAILAYKQPVTKTEMEKIRGVSCDYAVQKLLEKELVTILGRSEGPGRPLLYGTSEKFMDYFGLKSLEDLPKPKDFHMPENTIGEAAPVEETVATNPEEGGTGEPGVTEAAAPSEEGASVSAEGEAPSEEGSIVIKEGEELSEEAVIVAVEGEPSEQVGGEGVSMVKGAPFGEVVTQEEE